MLPAVVPEAARRFGDHPVLVSAQGWTLSYLDLDRFSDEAAVGLGSAGVGHGDVVALVVPSVPEYVVLYVALAKLGAVTAGVNDRLAPGERAAVVELAAPRLVVTTAALAGALPDGVPVVEVSPSTDGDDLLRSLRVPGEAPPALAPDPARVVALVFTSGTTGRPKAAVFTEAQLAAVSRIDGAEDWGGGGPMLASTSFAHIGFTTKLPWYLRKGTTHHLFERWRAGDALRVISETRMTSVGGVAPQIALMLRHPDFDSYDLSCVQLVIAGAGPSSPALVHEARERFGAGYSIRYSSTESGGVGTGTAPDVPDAEALYTVGRPRPGVEISVRDDDGRSVRSGEVGSVWIRSGAVMAGYWRDEAATAEALMGDGWLRTGDLGAIEGDGLLRLAGRSSEVYIRGGYNVHPLEVEAVLGTHPGVAEVAVVGRPDPVMGEIGVAVVVPADPAAPPTLEELRAHGRSSLAAHKLPEDVRVVEGLPLTAMQKLDRRALAAVEAEQ